MGDEKLREALKVAIVASNPGSVHDANRNEELKLTKCTKCSCTKCSLNRMETMEYLRILERRVEKHEKRIGSTEDHVKGLVGE